MLNYDFGFVLKTIEDMTVYDQQETPHILRVNEYLSEVNAYLNLELWNLLKSTHPEIREFHACCFLSDKSNSDGKDSRFLKKHGEFEVWCSVDKKDLQGKRYKAVRTPILTCLLNATIAAMSKRDIGGHSQLDALRDLILDDIPRDKDRRRKAKQFMETFI